MSAGTAHATAAVAASESPAAFDKSPAAQYLTFFCAGEEYGVEILRVQEITVLGHVTRVPYAPPFVLGVMNLRGAIVPVLDLRTCCALPKRAFDASTVVIVVRVQSAHGDKTVGIVVDGVSDVYSFGVGSILPTPEMANSSAGSWVHGLASVDNKIVMLLDIDKLIGDTFETNGAANQEVRVLER